MSRTLKNATGAAVLALAAVTGVGAAWAQQLDPGISCIEGEVPANDWAELTSNYRESIWDSKAAVRLRSQDDKLDLTVTDNFGTSVCEQTADLRTRCKFNFSSSYSGMFNIRIDNTQQDLSRYRLCAE